MQALKFFNLSNAAIDKKFFEFLVTLLKTENIDAKVESLDETGLSWIELQQKMQGAVASITDFRTSPDLVAKIPAQPTDVKAFQCADSLFFENGQWWPRLNLKEAIRLLIVKKVRSLDIRESAYVIGEGPMLRLLAGLVVTFGFSKVYMVGLSNEDVHNQIEILKKNYVGIDWRPLDTNQLTMQTVGATLLVNSVSLTEDTGLASDLAYFNFMKGQGLVVDLEVYPSTHPILEEAEKASLRVLSGFDVRAQQDYLFLQRIGLGEIIKFETYRDALRAFLISHLAPSA